MLLTQPESTSLGGLAMGIDGLYGGGTRCAGCASSSRVSAAHGVLKQVMWPSMTCGPLL